MVSDRGQSGWSVRIIPPPEIKGPNLVKGKREGGEWVLRHVVT